MTLLRALIYIYIYSPLLRAITIARAVYTPLSLLLLYEKSFFLVLWQVAVYVGITRALTGCSYNMHISRLIGPLIVLVCVCGI